MSLRLQAEAVSSAFESLDCSSLLFRVMIFISISSSPIFSVRISQLKLESTASFSHSSARLMSSAIRVSFWAFSNFNCWICSSRLTPGREGGVKEGGGGGVVSDFDCVNFNGAAIVVFSGVIDQGSVEVIRYLYCNSTVIVD